MFIKNIMILTISICNLNNNRFFFMLLKMLYFIKFWKLPSTGEHSFNFLIVRKRNYLIILIWQYYQKDSNKWPLRHREHKSSSFGYHSNEATKISTYYFWNTFGLHYHLKSVMKFKSFAVDEMSKLNNHVCFLNKI